MYVHAVCTRECTSRAGRTTRTVVEGWVEPLEGVPERARWGTHTPWTGPCGDVREKERFPAGRVRGEDPRTHGALVGATKDENPHIDRGSEPLLPLDPWSCGPDTSDVPPPPSPPELRVEDKGRTGPLGKEDPPDHPGTPVQPLLGCPRSRRALTQT